MYTGSMRGAGAMMFAVWGYVLTHQQPNRERTHFTVELNAAIVAFLIGEKEEEVEETIKQCCEPDPHSRSQIEGGRKLLKLGAYLYEVVNGAYYDKLKREVDKRESDRVRQERHRNRKTEDCSTGNNGTKRELWVDACKVYDLYPRKVGKQAAVRKIASAIKEFGLERVLEATKLYAKAWEGAMDLNFCPYPATWFGQHRFNDDPATWVRNDGKNLPESREIHEVIEIPKL